MFASVEGEAPVGGVMAVDQTGRVSHFFVDEKNIVPYICNQLNDYELGVQMAKRHNLPGAEGIFKQVRSQTSSPRAVYMCGCFATFGSCASLEPMSDRVLTCCRLCVCARCAVRR
jgi:hypothetical protein